jgi:hypothetical protein
MPDDGPFEDVIDDSRGVGFGIAGVKVENLRSLLQFLAQGVKRRALSAASRAYSRARVWVVGFGEVVRQHGGELVARSANSVSSASPRGHAGRGGASLSSRS